jgi:hypothetical protein
MQTWQWYEILKSGVHIHIDTFCTSNTSQMTNGNAACQDKNNTVYTAIYNTRNTTLYQNLLSTII